MYWSDWTKCPLPSVTDREGSDQPDPASSSTPSASSSGSGPAVLIRFQDLAENLTVLMRSFYHKIHNDMKKPVVAAEVVAGVELGEELVVVVVEVVVVVVFVVDFDE